ncbi:MAG: plastocyanin/azurin family copper-binding protein [bacterium]
MNDSLRRRGFVALAICVTFVASACGKDTKTADTGAPAPSEQKPAAEQPAGTGKTILVELYTDATGNYFKPNKIEAHKGDIIRFTLKMGVHNVHFLPDSNPGKTGLPPASDMLQLPDQTYDVPVTFAKGKYYFQCDPHALLGMKGHLEVED